MHLPTKALKIHNLFANMVLNMTEKTRSPICSVLGHVDHGKSSILDAIRDSSIIDKEAGSITQAIGASIVPMEVLRKKCGAGLASIKNLNIPGLLFIDTPGHAAFTSLRKRGGNLADIAILVVDINEGFKPQTVEALEILKSYKTPFIVAANKIDLTPRWKSPSEKTPILKNISSQIPEVINHVETKIYELVGKLSELGLPSERFDRITDFTKEIGIIPLSAKTKEGLPELLIVLTALAQKYLEKNLKLTAEGPAKGTILEVKEEKGLGVTLDLILYDGTLKVNDTIVIGSMNEAIVTKVRGLFQPAELAEMRDKKSKFKPVKEVVAATGVKISAPNINDVVAGMPLRSCNKINLQETIDEVESEIDEVVIETDGEGIIIKADTIGSLEALTKLLQEKKVPIRKAMIGNISKKDVTEANTNNEEDPLNAVILGFNVAVSEEIKNSNKNVKILLSDIIYSLLDQYEEWKIQKEKDMKREKMTELAMPCKFKIMENHVFRQSNPAIVGIDILAGKIKNGASIMKKGITIGVLKNMQSQKKQLGEAEAGKQVAASIMGPTVGRQIEEGDILYTYIPENDFKKLKDLKTHLSPEEKDILREVADIMRETNAVWGV